MFYALKKEVKKNARIANYLKEAIKRADKAAAEETS